MNHDPVGSFHHVSGPNHTAHLAVVPCNPERHSGCAWPIQPIGDDGLCDWCREFDQDGGDQR